MLYVRFCNKHPNTRKKILKTNRFHRDVDACFVPSDRLAVLARNCGLSPDKIRLHGLPIRPGFWGEQSAKADLQEKLGLKPGVKTCLVVGGGDGVGGLQGIADSVGHKLGEEKAETQVRREEREERSGVLFVLSCLVLSRVCLVCSCVCLPVVVLCAAGVNRTLHRFTGHTTRS